MNLLEKTVHVFTFAFTFTADFGDMIHFHVLPSRSIKCKTSRYSRSFVPVAIRMLNAK